MCRHDRLKVLVETSGIGWPAGSLERIRGVAGDRVIWIVSLDAPDAQTYRSLRGDGFEEATNTARALLELFPLTSYVQAVRMRQNEEQLETFYRSWKKETDRVIVQKYDHYCGFLEERKVTDLSPVNRFPCRHLMRDLVVRLDGSVTVCREDLRKDHVLGNALKEPVETIWARGLSWYRDHISGEYPELCKSCDEYYTYNF